MKRIVTLILHVFCFSGLAKAQLLLPAVNTPSVITFSGFSGAGFQPVPAAGELSSNTWAINGMSDGTLAFGGTMNAANTDFTRGVNNGGTATGGIYAFDVYGDTTLGVQPIGADFTPGDFILKAQNTTGTTVTSVYMGYDLWINNDQGRANLFNFSWSTDNIVYVPVTALFDTSAMNADTLSWQKRIRKTIITGLNVANNGFIYFKWHGDDAGGAGSRDEFALDNITVIPNPVLLTASFNASQNSGCEGDTVCFTDASVSLMGNVNSWVWTFGDGGISALQNPCHQYASAGAYTVKLVVKDSQGNRDSTTQTVTIHPAPVANFTANAVCQGDMTLFSDVSTVGGGNTITSWAWDFDNDGNVDANTQNPAYTYPMAGLYTAALCVTTNNGCSACTTMQVTVNALPVAIFTYTSNGCGSNTINFQDASQGANVFTWSWDFGDGSPIDNQVNPVHTYNAGGIYTVTMVVTDNLGCSDTLAQQVPVGSVLPVAQIGTADTCFGAPMNFIDQSTIAAGSIVAWSWSFGDGNTANTQNAQHAYGSPGQYTVMLIVVSNTGCTDTAWQVVVVPPAVAAGFTYQSAGNVVTFTSTVAGGVPGYTYEWDFGDGSPLNTQQSPVHTYLPPINLPIIVCFTAYDSFGCSDSTCQNIILNGIEESAAAAIKAYPNPFKGTFRISIEKEWSNLYIENILGEQVLQRKGSAGVLELELGDQPAGIYILKIQLKEGSILQQKLIKE